MRIVCQQTILMKYHASFVIFEKAGKYRKCHLLQIIGGALGVKIYFSYFSSKTYVVGTKKELSQ